MFLQIIKLHEKNQQKTAENVWNNDFRLNQFCTFMVTQRQIILEI